MIASVAHKTPGIILDKLTRLLNALQEVKNNYEQAAKRIQNLQLRLSLLGLAQESKQYANELIAHIETLGGKLQDRIKSDFNKVEKTEEIPELPGNIDDLGQLKLGEQMVMKTYRDVLNEPFLYDTIRQMVRYQQNGLLHCFSQIRMLYATLLKSSS
jgi:1,2-phenylacetyl-CoA epoxidase catalytic subunit